MGKTIELELSDALYAQVSAEAEASGQRLFAYIRGKLSTQPAPQRQRDVIREGDPLPLREKSDKRRVPDEYDHDDGPLRRELRFTPTDPGAFAEASLVRDDFAEARFARIEETLNGLTAFLTHQYAVANQPSEPEPAQPIDLDAMVDSQVAQAEAEGRTEYVPDPVREVMHVAGVRPLQKRPTPFAATNQPRHLQGL